MCYIHWSKKTAPFLFFNNFIKSRFILTTFGAQILECICNKTVTKWPISPNECHYTTLWNTTCVKLFITTVMQALNVTNWQLQTHQNKCSKCLPLALTRALRRFCHLLIAWSLMLCWIPDHAKIVSSVTFAECLCIWCVPLTSVKCQFPWRSDG